VANRLSIGCFPVVGVIPADRSPTVRTQQTPENPQCRRQRGLLAPLAGLDWLRLAPVIVY